MSNDIDLLKIIAQEVFLLLSPVVDAVKTTETLEILGEDATTLETFEITQPMQLLALIHAAGLDPDRKIKATHTGIVEAVSAIDGFNTSSIADYKEIGKDVFGAIDALINAIQLTDPEATIPNFVGHLIVRWLDDHHSVAFSVLSLLGVIDDTAYRKKEPGQFRYDEIGRAFGQPLEGFKANSGFGTDDLAFDATFDHLQILLAAIGVLAFDIDAPPHKLGGTATLPTDRDPDPGLSVLVLNSDLLMLNATLLGLPKVGAEAPGFLLTLFGEGIVKGRFDLSDDFEVRLKGTTAIDANAGIVLRPSGVTAEMRDGGALPEVKATIEVGRKTVELREVSLGPLKAEMPVWPEAHVGAALKKTPDVYAEVVMRGVKLTIGSGGAGDGFIKAGDGFIKKLLPGGGFGTRITPRLGFSLKDGVYFDRGSGLRADLPTGLELGALLAVTGLGLAAKPTADALDLDLTAIGNATLGPIKATVEGIGSAVKFDFKLGKDGKAPYEINSEFVPPTGLGFVIKKGPVKGGGFISRDPEKGRYAGVLSLKIKSVGLTALGVLDTKMPDGEDGFSLILFLAGRFKAIPIGFGFGLVSVGGLLGLHRDVDVDKLFAGVRSGAAGKLLNPKDPVKEANALITAASDIFPVKRGQFILGPTVGLVWGTPKPLVTMDLALAVTFPEPLRIILIGTVAAKLPDKKVKVVDLNIDIAGVLDLSASRFDMEGRVYNSKIQLIPVQGGFALRSNWGAEAGFAFSIGGFHPDFEPPEGFPKLDRLGASLSKKKDFKLDLLGYLAVTSNSLQLGAKVQLVAKAAGYGVTAELGFDALLIFDPLSLDVFIYAGAAIKRGKTNIATLRLEARLRGPGPWVISGKAVLEIAFLDIDIDVNGQFGSAQTELPDPVDLRGLIAEALAAPGSWRAASGETGPLILDGVDDKILPIAPIRIAQTVAPLKTPINVVAGRPVDRLHRFEMGALSIGGVAFDKTGTVEGQFAPGAFQKMDDAEKLSADGFAPFPSGATYDARTAAPAFDAPVAAPEGPEVIVIDEAPPADHGTITLRAHGLTRAEAEPVPAGRITVRTEPWVAVDAKLRATSAPATHTEVRATSAAVARLGEVA